MEPLLSHMTLQCRAPGRRTKSARWPTYLRKVIPLVIFGLWSAFPQLFFFPGLRKKGVARSIPCETGSDHGIMSSFLPQVLQQWFSSLKFQLHLFSFACLGPESHVLKPSSVFSVFLICLLCTVDRKLKFAFYPHPIIALGMDKKLSRLRHG